MGAIDLAGFHSADFPSVYPPDDDSYLLAKAVKNLAFGKVLDVGCGSGIQSIVAAKKRIVRGVTGVDVNLAAVECSQRNAELNGVSQKCVFLKSDLFSKLEGMKFDTIIFNPPYLPTSKSEKIGGKLNLAFDGGADGRRALDRFLKKFASHLGKKGILLLLSSSRASTGGFGDGNSETVGKLEKMGFGARIISHENFFFERLAVVKAVRQ
ncbi:methyltransferase [Candidatus Micrarchaeota archaeon]|nr:methyltransferase [Candidatus Micrarchaeota archaeon]